MLNANEVKKRMPKTRVLPPCFISAEQAAELQLPEINERICRAASAGYHELMLKKSEIKSCAFGEQSCIDSNAKIMDAIAKACRKAKFKVRITPSYSSIHIMW